jgi:hypothetical protein
MTNHQITVPKKSKKSSAAPVSDAAPIDIKPTRRPSAKGKKSGESPAKKASAGKVAKAKKPTRSPSIPPTPEEIQLRAYFISERRHRLDLPGDASSDWLEAIRQLQAELARS